MPPNLTHALQPLDRSYMFAFKKTLAKQASMHLAREVVGSMTDTGAIQLTLDLVTLGDPEKRPVHVGFRSLAGARRKARSPCQRMVTYPASGQ